MIKKFDNSTALIIVDAQKGVNDTNYYGGSKGKRNNRNAEKTIISVLNNWRNSNRKIAFTPRAVINAATVSLASAGLITSNPGIVLSDIMCSIG